MNMKEWWKKHKKELLVGVLAAGGTAVCFWLKGKGVDPYARLSLGLQIGSLDERWGNPKANTFDSNIYLNKPDLKVRDLGKLGELLKQQIPTLPDDVGLDWVRSSYSITRKGELK